MNTIIYFIRHGEVKNPKHVFYGRLPHFGLDKRGLEQTEKLAAYFEKVKLDAIYSSPLLRSRLTAKAILDEKPNIKIHYSRLIMEWNNPLWEGKDYFTRDTKLIDIYRECPTKLAIKGAETIPDIAKRMVKFTNQILEKHKGEKVAVVSHGDPIRLTKLYYENKSLDELHDSPCTNTSITTLVFSGKKLVKSDYKEIHPRANETFWTKTRKELV